MKMFAFTLLKEVAFWLGRTLIKAAQDKALQSAIKEAVLQVEHASATSDLDGLGKLDQALRIVGNSGLEALKKETTASLRAKVEDTVAELAGKGLVHVSNALDKFEAKL